MGDYTLRQEETHDQLPRTFVILMRIAVSRPHPGILVSKFDSRAVLGHAFLSADARHTPALVPT